MSDATTNMMLYDAAKKSAGVAYALWFFFGFLGAHRFYLGETGTGIAILSITLTSILLMVVFIGVITIWIAVIWVLVDAFLIPGMVQKYNTALIQRMAPSGV